MGGDRCSCSCDTAYKARLHRCARVAAAVREARHSRCRRLEFAVPGCPPQQTFGRELSRRASQGQRRDRPRWLQRPRGKAQACCIGSGTRGAAVRLRPILSICLLNLAAGQSAAWSLPREGGQLARRASVPCLATEASAMLRAGWATIGRTARESARGTSAVWAELPTVAIHGVRGAALAAARGAARNSCARLSPQQVRR